MREQRFRLLRLCWAAPSRSIPTRWTKRLALPTEQAARIALRTQQVIAHESGVADTADPLAGSYAIEQLTDEIERRPRSILKKIEAMGGMLRAIETGYVQREIQGSAYRYQRAIENEEAIVVGVNKYQMDEETTVPLLRVNHEVEQAQVERVRAVRARRDRNAAEQALVKLEEGQRAAPRIFYRAYSIALRLL